MDETQTIVSKGKIYRPIHDQFLTESDVTKAEKELNETPETRTECLQKLREMLAKESVMNPRTDDIFLLRFLRVRKFDCENAFKTLQQFYSFRAEHPFLYLLPSQEEKALKANFFTVLPYRDDEGRAIISTKLGAWDPDDIPFSHFISAIHLAQDCLMDNSVTQINGFVGIWDTKDVPLSLLFQFSPRRIRLVFNLIQDRTPCRMKMLYIVNPLPLTYSLYQIAKQFIKEKFRNRVKILQRTTDLHKYLDPAILPEEYGGHLPKYDSQLMVQWILSQENKIKFDRTFGYKAQNKAIEKNEI